MGRKTKIVYCYFSAGAISGMGANSRVNGFCRNLEQSGLLDKIDFSLAGITDFEIIPNWMPYLKRAIANSDKRLLIQYSSPRDMQEFDFTTYLAKSKELQAALAGVSAELQDRNEQIDLLLVDSHPKYVALAIANRNPYRAANVWAVLKQTPGVLEGLSPLCFDRCYFLEPFEPQGWFDNYSKEYCRTPAELENGRGYQDPHITADDYVKDNPEAAKAWGKLNEKFVKLHAADYKTKEDKETALMAWRQETDTFMRGLLRDNPTLQGISFDWQNWYKRNTRKGRKLIPPMVNVELARVLPRDEARKVLCDYAGVKDDGRPIALATGTLGGITKDDLDAFNYWLKTEFEEAGLTPDTAYYIRSGVGTPGLAEIWRYFGGADYLFANSSYNIFWEANYLYRNGLFKGVAKFYPSDQIHPDHKWRFKHQKTLWDEPDIPAGEGGEFLVKAIKDKFKL